MTGKATRAELEQLHALLLRDLAGRLTGPRRPPAEHLAVTRAFLADNGFAGHWAMPPKVQRQLEKLYAALCMQLAKAMAEDDPSPKMLGEVRAFLRSQGIDKDYTATAGKAAAGRAAELLAGLELPFKPH